MFWKIKLVLSLGLLKVLEFFLLRSSCDIQKFIFELRLWKRLLIVQTLLKADPESMFRLTDFAVRIMEGFQEAACVLWIGFPKAVS
jgi:hypothetical protein